MRYFFLFLLLINTTNLLSQGTPPLKMGKAQMNLVVDNTLESTAVYLGMDLGVDKNVTLGASLGLISLVGYENYKLGTYFRIDYHFNSVLQISNKWDLYFGGRSNLQFFSEPTTPHIVFMIDTGGRWYISKHLGINIEYGLDPINYYTDYVQFGVSYRL